MPAHIRRPKQSGAIARLPPNRLPLGTPQLPTKPQASSRANTRSTSANSAHITTSCEKVPVHLGEGTTDVLDPAQAAMSTAEAKLQRQNERIQLAEAALANPPQLDRSRPQSRAKSKFPPSLRPSDESADSVRSRTNSVSSGGVAIETRVNSYRSEGSHPPRHYTKSSLDISAATTPEAAQMERQDSVLDDAGFQTYTSRRSSRRGELGAYEDKPEVKQITVEAPVDQREILTVFANALPGLDFLKCQAGRLDGQVQFVQHPNGDVSAHMWSMRTYQWNNIGAFSNIRKKIEGQLAGDHLKGETTYQKLQQNTLAYFRTIAKQREAATTGLAFGQTEIQQLLPEPSQNKQPEASSKKLDASTPAFSHNLQNSRLATQSAPEDISAQPHRVSQQLVKPTETHSFYAVPQGLRVVDNTFTAPLSPKNGRGAEDPFTANTFLPTFTRLGPEYNGGTVAGPAKQQPTFMRPPVSINTRHSAHGLYSKTSLPAVPDIRMTYKPLPSSRTSSSEAIGRSFGSQSYPRPSITGASSFLPARVAGTGPDADRRHLSTVSMDSLRGKPVTPLQAREAMRENLFKISDHAVERSVSRENLQKLSIAAVEREQNQSSRRTVLHDPFQSDDRHGYEEYDSASIPHRSESELHNGFTQIASHPVMYREPDIIDEDYPTPTSRVHSNSYDFDTEPHNAYSLRSSSKISEVSPGRELKNWWTSGSKFARQEEVYRSIKAMTETGLSNQASIDHTSSITDSASSTAGDVLTRVLIPVCENLASYVGGPLEKRRDYWSRWSRAPEWCIDRGPNGNTSFYEDAWQPTVRLGRDSRHSSSSIEGGSRFAGVAVPASLERRLEHNRWS